MADSNITLADKAPACLAYDSIPEMEDAELTMAKARAIVAGLSAWAGQYDHDEAKLVQRALSDLNRVLVRGWTEVDEALTHLSFLKGHIDDDAKSRLSMPVSFLHRWQGRGGRIGNGGLN